jgi:hypothetical protein
MKNSNSELAKFCIGKVGTPYVMGTQGKTLTKDLYNRLVKWNPGKWFTLARRLKVKKWIGQKVTDCHGLIEWFVREQSGAAYDTTADGAFLAATEKGTIESIPEQPGICVRYKGHVGIYIGGGYVVEARGFDYGVCITQLNARPWTHWYRHNRIKYTEKMLPTPEPMQINGTTDRYSVVWLQLALNRQIEAGYIQGADLTVDGVYGAKTARVVAEYWKKKGWSKESEVWSIGKGTVQALQKK